MKIEDAIAQSREIFGEEAQLAAVKQNGYAIQFIDKSSEAVQLEAVKQNGLAIKYIDSPSEEVMQTALDQDENSKQYFKKSWAKNIKSKTKLTVAEIEEKLGYKIEIIAEK